MILFEVFVTKGLQKHSEKLIFPFFVICFYRGKFETFFKNPVLSNNLY